VAVHQLLIIYRDVHAST